MTEPMARRYTWKEQLGAVVCWLLGHRYHTVRWLIGAKITTHTEKCSRCGRRHQFVVWRDD